MKVIKRNLNGKETYSTCESWWERDWFLASLIAIITVPFLILFYILNCFVVFVRFFREAVWIEYKCFLVIIGEVSGKEAKDEFENRIGKRDL